MIKGIGPVYGKKLVQAFGEAMFDVIEQEPARLQEVHGIGPKRAARIVAGWADQKVIREIMLFLHSHGVGTSRAVRIFKTYGADAIQLISENPYRLAWDIRGIGLKTADQIAQRLGIEATAMMRARAGIGYALAEAMDEGHCGLPLDELVPLAEGLLEIPAAIIEAALEFELQDGAVVADSIDERPYVVLAGLHGAERAIAARLQALAAGELPWPAIDAEKAIPWVEAKVCGFRGRTSRPPGRSAAPRGRPATLRQRRAARAVRRDPAPDRPAARAARAGDVTRRNGAGAETEGRAMRARPTRGTGTAPIRLWKQGPLAISTRGRRQAAGPG